MMMMKSVLLFAVVLAEPRSLKGGAGKIRTFTSSGTFRPEKAGTFEFDVVAGGGSGGNGVSGKGGAGGGGGGQFIRSFTVKVEAGKEYPIIVGAGGKNGEKGGDSSAFGNVAKGGASGTKGSGPPGKEIGGKGGRGSKSFITDASYSAGGNGGHAGKNGSDGAAKTGNGGGGGSATGKAGSGGSGIVVIKPKN